MEPGEGSSWNNLRRGMFEGPEDEANALKSIKFANPEEAFNLYIEFGAVYGFSVRKYTTSTIKSSDELGHHYFVCSREGRHDYQRDSGPLTKCGCDAKMLIRFDQDSGLWYVACLNNDHNHPVVDIAKMISMVKELEDGDAKIAIMYLRRLASIDPFTYWRHKVDGNGMLSHLFWSDGISQVEYKTFGDVLAIDATYKMNKHNYRLVVFSGSNHHNKICVFGSAIVPDQSEETYVWLLQQFMEMKGNHPQLVITNGDSSLRNAINFVFPQAHHRLCSWNLVRNASAKVRKTRFTHLFKECVTDDCEIEEWEDKWKAMVKECDVNHIEWVQDMYEMKHMWATAYIRGNFFQGYRTSSRCEGLLKQVNKFDQSRSSLAELLHNFQLCLHNMSQKEHKDNVKYCHTVPAFWTEMKPLEKCGASVYTRVIFYMYHSLILKSHALNVLLDPKKTASSTIYTVEQYCKPSLNWTVSFYPENRRFKCSCFRMESFGIPCDHIIKVMIVLNMPELPKSLVLNRWTKMAKKTVEQPVACTSGNDFNGKRKRDTCETSEIAKKHGEKIGTSAECEKSLGSRNGDTAEAMSKGR